MRQLLETLSHPGHEMPAAYVQIVPALLDVMCPVSRRISDPCGQGKRRFPLLYWFCHRIHRFHQSPGFPGFPGQRQHPDRPRNPCPRAERLTLQRAPDPLCDQLVICAVFLSIEGCSRYCSPGRARPRVEVGAPDDRVTDTCFHECFHRERPSAAYSNFGPAGISRRPARGVPGPLSRHLNGDGCACLRGCGDTEHSVAVGLPASRGSTPRAGRVSGVIRPP